MDTISELTAWLPRLLQVADTAFPTGAYAHSGGFEEMVRMGLAGSTEDLERFLDVHVIPALTHIDLPLVREARAALLSGDLEELLELDHLAGILRSPRELREGSLQLGRRRLAALHRLGDEPFLEEFHEATRRNPLVGHHCVVWGAASARAPLAAALAGYFYQAVSSFCFAAPKLIRVGQDGVQRVLARRLARTGESLDASMGIAREEIGWFDPLLDIAAMRHEIADERLFIS